MSRLAGRTRIARKQLVIEAVGLALVALVPCRQVTGPILSALAMASWRRFAGGAGEGGAGGRAGPPPQAPGPRPGTPGTGPGGAPAPRRVRPAPVSPFHPHGGVSAL